MYRTLSQWCEFIGPTLFHGPQSLLKVEELALPKVPFAIGPWHIRPHKAECNVRYNSRYMCCLGFVYGDLIEHLWANIRRHWYITAYMSPAAGEDFITGLVRNRMLASCSLGGAVRIAVG